MVTTVSRDELDNALDKTIEQQMGIAKAVKQKLIELATSDRENQRAILEADIKSAEQYGLIRKDALPALLEIVQAADFSMRSRSLGLGLTQAAPELFSSMASALTNAEDLGNWPEAGVVGGAIIGAATAGLPGAAVGAAVGGACGTIIGRLIREFLR